MKINLLLLVVVAGYFPSSVMAVQCGRWYSNSCLADEDIRYDQDASNTLTDQAEIWGKLQGFFRATVTSFGPTGEKGEPGFFNVLDPTTNSSLPYPTAPYLDFFNLTFDGSRHYFHRYSVFSPASAEFCAQSVPLGFVNAFPPGVCGEDGFALKTEVYVTSSYEKDGRIVIAPFGSALGGGETASPYFGLPVDDIAYFSSFRGDSTFNAASTICIDGDCNQWTVLNDAYGPGDAGELSLSFSTRTFATRINSEDEFVAEIMAAYQAYNVTPEQQVAAPMEGPCSFETCPNETDWCTIDPNCSQSPYQEPEGSVKAGPIVGFVVAFFVIVIGLL